VPKFNHNGVDIDLPAKGGAKLTYQGKSWQIAVSGMSDQRRREYVEEQAVVLRQRLDAVAYAQAEFDRQDERAKNTLAEAEKWAAKTRKEAKQALIKAQNDLVRFG
jgi:hypothetical protein